MLELTPEQQQDIQERAEAFMKEYNELVEKHGIKMSAAPVFVPNERGSWECMVQGGPIDTKYLPVKSNFMKQ